MKGPRETRSPRGRQRALLVFSPHPDDEAIGAPCLLDQMGQAGWRIVNVVLSLGRPADRDRRRAEAERAAERAGYEIKVIDPPVPLSSTDDLAASEILLSGIIDTTVKQVGASVVVSPSPHDGHHAHEVVGRAVERSLSALPYPPVWWMTRIWGDLPVPTLFVEVSHDEMMRAVSVLEEYVGEVGRNDYRHLLRGKARADAVLGSELVFGFGTSGVSGQPYAELLTEAVYADGEWLLGSARVLRAGSPLCEPSQFTLTQWLRSSSARSVILKKASAA